MKKIRCAECGAVIAFENDDGTITVMCNHYKERGRRCKAINIVAVKKQNIKVQSVTN